MICVFPNQKGGVSKTVSTLHFAAALAAKGYKALIIDCDPQCDLSFALGIKKENDYNIVDFLENKKDFRLRQKSENLFILPGSEDFFCFNYEISALKDVLYLVRDNGSSIADYFDFIFIDVPPARISPLKNKRFPVFTEAELAIYAADAFLIPLLADAFSAKNADAFLGKVSSFIKHFKLNINFLGFFFGKVLLTSNSYEFYANKFRKHNSSLLLKSFIRQDLEVEHAILKGRTIFQYKPNSRAASDYIAFCDEFLSLIK
ncbi:MAG: ParA family protein [Cellulophaga sp.]